MELNELTTRLERKLLVRGISRLLESSHWYWDLELAAIVRSSSIQTQSGFDYNILRIGFFRGEEPRLCCWREDDFDGRFHWVRRRLEKFARQQLPHLAVSELQAFQCDPGGPVYLHGQEKYFPLDAVGLLSHVSRACEWMRQDLRVLHETGKPKRHQGDPVPGIIYQTFIERAESYRGKLETRIEEVIEFLQARIME